MQYSIYSEQNLLRSLDYHLLVYWLDLALGTSLLIVASITSINCLINAFLLFDIVVILLLAKLSSIYLVFLAQGAFLNNKQMYFKGTNIENKKAVLSALWFELYLVL